MVLWVLQMVRGVDGQQRRWKWMSPFTFSMIQPFDEVFADFNRWNQRRIENDEVWALWDVICGCGGSCCALGYGSGCACAFGSCREAFESQHADIVTHCL